MVASKLIALCALLATAATAQDVEYNRRVASNDFWKRATSSKFKAAEDTKAGNSCDAAFGAGYITCREKSAHDIRLCYNPSIGQVCCQNQWGCPSDSYCLTEGLCCPSGVDPAQCAGAYSVGLPSSLSTADSGPAHTTAPPPIPSTTYTSTITTSTPVATINSTHAVEAAGYASPTDSAPHVVVSSIYVVPIPLSTAYNHTTLGTATGSGYTASHPSGSASGPATATAPTGKVPVYTGAATANSQIGTWTGLAALLAVAGLL